MKLAIITLILSTLALFTGCSISSEYPGVEISPPANFSVATGTSGIGVGHWAEIYNEPELTELIERARLHNRSLSALYQRTLQSRAILRRERAEFLPQIGSSASYERFENSEETGSGNNDEDYEARVDLGWEIDLFGRVARLVEAAKADTAFAEAAYEDLLLITETDAAINFFRIRALDREIAAVTRSVETRRKSLDIVNKRFQSGVINDLDVAQAETLLAESEAEIAVLQRERDILEHALAVLTGQMAIDYSLSREAISGAAVLPPVGLPSELLLRRPDLRQAEYALQSANARVGLAKANFFPRITISGDAGYAAMDANNWFQNSAGFYSIGPQISLPIFQGGRLRAELSRSEAAYAESFERYQQAILEAFAEVENALSSWRYLATQRSARERAAASAARAQSISEKQYRNGLVDFITALDSERVALDAERRLAQVIGDEYVNSILLIRAIGGNWK